MKKDTVIHVRCTNEQKKKIEVRAKKAEISISEYVLKSSLTSRTRISSTSKDAARTIAQCQVSINDACIEAQNCHDQNERDRIMAKLDNVQEGLDEIWRLLK